MKSMNLYFKHLMELLTIPCFSKTCAIGKSIALLIFLTSIQAHAANLDSESLSPAPGEEEVATIQASVITGQVTDEEGNVICANGSLICAD